MSDSPSPIHDAITDRDAGQLRALILGGEFVLLSTTKCEEDEDGNIGAITAEIEDIEVLVVFSSEQTAGHFVHESGDLFQEDEEVDGILVEGDALLDYLPEGYGILLDPESDSAIVIEPALIAEVQAISP